MPLDFKHRWDLIPPNKRRWIILGSCLAVLLTASALLTKGGQPKRAQTFSDELRTNVLLPAKRDTTLDAMSGEILAMQQQIDRLDKTLKVNDATIRQIFESKLKEVANSKDADSDSKLAMLEKKVDILLDHKARNISAVPPLPADEVKRAIPTPFPNDTPSFQPATPAKGPDLRVVSEESDQTNDLVAGNQNDVKSAAPGADSASKTPQPNIGLGQVSQLSPITKSSYGGLTERNSKDNKPSSDHRSLWLPAGAMLQGVLLNGLDAPTSTTGQKNPTPVLMRIKHEAILPNRFRMDVRECFVLASGYGVMSSERAVLRTEKLSCVRQDGGVIETALDGYLVGSDGKVGLRGRLVSKQGQMIARSMVAGVLSGFSGAVTPSAVPVLSLDSSDTTQYQMPDLGMLGMSVGLRGAGNAMSNISKYYLDMAQELFPVIEVDAGRKATIMVINGATLKL